MKRDRKVTLEGTTYRIEFRKDRTIVYAPDPSYPLGQAEEEVVDEVLRTQVLEALARRTRASARQSEINSALWSVGLVKVRGSAGGVFWE